MTCNQAEITPTIGFSSPVDLAEHWAQAISAAVTTSGTGSLIRTSTSDRLIRDSAALTTLRSWIYIDVHLGGCEISPGTSLDTLTTLEELRPGTWPLAGCTIISSNQEYHRVRSAHGQEFLARDDEVTKDGGQVILNLPRLRPGALPGWCSLYGPNGPVREAARVYVHLTDSRGLPQLVGLLEEVTVPWALKATTGPGIWTRPDCVVVYTSDSNIPEILNTAFRIPRKMLADSVPGFAVPVSRGLAYAGTVSSGGSHGADVAHVAAEALLEQRDLTDTLRPLAEEASLS